uniref:(northern house mosquito) hypothetical protein n=1 Tax=Culex pipiens TaxID=7175 RepID=A0A8D8EV60_CULPI
MKVAFLLNSDSPPGCTYNSEMAWPNSTLKRIGLGGRFRIADRVRSAPATLAAFSSIVGISRRNLNFSFRRRCRKTPDCNWEMHTWLGRRQHRTSSGALASLGVDRPLPSQSFHRLPTCIVPVSTVKSSVGPVIMPKSFSG